jgi:hypothetical protein
MDAIRVCDGDLLVLRTDQILDGEQVTDLKRRLRDQLDEAGLQNVRDLVLTAGLSLIVIRPEREPVAARATIRAAG